MAGAILSLKQNRAILKRRNVRELRDLIGRKSGKTDLEFKKISAQELAKIKDEIRKEAKMDARREIMIYFICIVLTAVIIYVTYLLLSA